MSHFGVRLISLFTLICILKSCMAVKTISKINSGILSKKISDCHGDQKKAFQHCWYLAKAEPTNYVTKV